MGKQMITTERKVGRPRSEVLTVKKSISLMPDSYAYLLALGEGSLSGGVSKVTQFHQNYFKPVKNLSKGSK